MLIRGRKLPFTGAQKHAAVGHLGRVLRGSKARSRADKVHKKDRQT